MTIEVRGIKVNYLHFGQGAETLLILQGWGTNAGLYRALAEHLGQHMQVLLPELPGFGETPEPQRAWDAGDYADFNSFIFFGDKLLHTSFHNKNLP